MKSLFFALVMVVCFFNVSYGQVLTLNSPETLAVPTAAKLDLRNVTIDIGNKVMIVTYRFLTSADAVIPTSDSFTINRTWTCRDKPTQLAADCTGVGVPYGGCTGVGTGTGLDPGSTCFTDTFAFVIRTQDVGVQIGKGLRALIWNKMKGDVLSAGNNATLP